MPLTGIIILCHGSRGERAIVELPVTMQEIVNGVKSFLPAKVEVAWAALQFNHPTLEETTESLVVKGVESIIIMPYFLFSGRHITEDIPEILDILTERHPDVEFIMAKALGDDERFIPQVINRIREVAPKLCSETPASTTPPQAIERQSMEIIEKLLSPTLKISGDERAVVKRIIHASGDPQIAGLIKFGPSAITCGINAMENSDPIFTDVRMVAAGINSRMNGVCGCPIFCAIDELKRQNLIPGRESTRAAIAIQCLGQKLNDAIVAIGNAPTALMALLELIDNHNVKPSLIVGMPVGFVQAVESKEALMKRHIPFITIAGTRGGSAMAAATVNALLKLAIEKNKILI